MRLPGVGCAPPFQTPPAAPAHTRASPRKARRACVPLTCTPRDLIPACSRCGSHQLRTFSTPDAVLRSEYLFVRLVLI